MESQESLNFLLKTGDFRHFCHAMILSNPHRGLPVHPCNPLPAEAAELVLLSLPGPGPFIRQLCFGKLILCPWLTYWADGLGGGFRL